MSSTVVRGSFGSNVQLMVAAALSTAVNEHRSPPVHAPVIAGVPRGLSTEIRTVGVGPTSEGIGTVQFVAQTPSTLCDKPDSSSTPDGCSRRRAGHDEGQLPFQDRRERRAELPHGRAARNKAGRQVATARLRPTDEDMPWHRRRGEREIIEEVPAAARPGASYVRRACRSRAW